MIRRIIIYPTYLSLFQRRLRTLENGGECASGRDALLFRKFREALAREACRIRGIRGIVPSDLDLQLLFMQTAREFPSARRAAGAETPAPALSEAAWRDVLAGLFTELLLPRTRLDQVLNAWDGDAAGPRRRLLAELFRAFEANARAAGYILPQDAFQAILDVLRGDPRRALGMLARTLPCSGRSPNRRTAGEFVLEFTAVRWLTPFQVDLVRALAELLGHERVVVRGALPAEFGADSLLGRLSGLLADPEVDAPITGWTWNVADAVRMQDPELLFGAERNIDFSRSVGIYGEVEDLARRIAWEIHEQHTPAHRITLIVRNIGEYSDAVADVFGRFGIPYYFRRGVPAASIPIVKTVLSLAELRAHWRRDTFCALLESPWMDWPEELAFIQPPAALADAIRRAGVPPRIEEAEFQLFRRLLAFLEELDARGQSIGDPKSWAEAAFAAWNALAAPAAGEARLKDHARELKTLARVRLLLPDPAAAAPRSSGSGPDPTAAEFAEFAPDVQEAETLNAQGWEFIAGLLDRLASCATLGEASFTAEEFAGLLAEFAAASTVPAPGARPDGVWVINPFDAAGLDFDAVLIAGLNAGVFPPETPAGAILTDSDRRWLHRHLPDLPATAFAEGPARAAMEDILFLTALTAARKRLVLSYRAVDEQEREQSPSIYFSTLWQIAGWAAAPPPGAKSPGRLNVSEYNRWRMGRPGGAFLREHLQNQQRQPHPFERKPFPGESFFATVPLGLARAEDEARQRLFSKGFDPNVEPIEAAPAAAAAGRDGALPETFPAEFAGPGRIIEALEIEKARTEASRPACGNLGGRDGAPPARPEFCGVIGPGLVHAGRWASLEFSPSDLEAMARCPFRYFLERMLRAEPVIPVESDPDPRNQGTAVHRILSIVYSFLAGHQETHRWMEQHAPEIRRKFASLAKPYLIRRRGAGRWILAGTNSPGGESANLLRGIRWMGEREDAYREFAAAVTDAVLNTPEARLWNLGDPRLLFLRAAAIREWVQNVLICDLRCACPDSRDRSRNPRNPSPWTQPDSFVTVPVLFEQPFGGASGKHLPVVLPPPGVIPGRALRLRGRVDRIDMIFDTAEHEFQGLRVVDYKGSARKGAKALAADVVRGLDCQLPAYALAALSRFFPHKPATWGSAAEPTAPTYVQYIPYRGPLEDKMAAVQSRYLEISRPAPEDSPDFADLTLLEAFRRRAHALAAQIRKGIFSVTPQTCDYCPYPGVCRVNARNLEAEEATP